MLVVRRSRREKESQGETLYENDNIDDALHIETDKNNEKEEESSSRNTAAMDTELYSDKIESSFTSPFAASRAEWDTPTDTETSTDSGFSTSKDEFATTDSSSSTDSMAPASSTVSNSGVYSYSFRRSQKQNDMEDNSQHVSGNKPSYDDTTNLDGQFSEIRNQFTKEEVVNTDIDNSGRVRKTKRKRSIIKRVETSAEPGIVSTGSMAKWAFGIPLHVMKEIVVPTVQVGTVVWFDFKVWLSCVIGGRAEDDYFVDVIEEVYEDSEVDSFSGRTETEQFGMDEELSEEEMQLLELQRNAGKAMKQVEGAFRVVQGGVQKMWNDLR